MMVADKKSASITPPHVWVHKQTGKTLLATPWWEILGSDEILDLKSKEISNEDPWPDRKIKIGTLTQVGWLLQNEHGVWFGVGPDAANYYDDMGEA